ncbi:MAG: MFS transporter [Candidatus Sungbacteria bacterium]|nr:MFS transporter [Candidatus Sungbacteria bacterium]
MLFRRATKILLTTQMIATGAMGLLSPIYAIYVEKLGGGILSAAGAWAIFSIVSGLLIIFLGQLTDRVKEPKYFIVAGFLVGSFGYFGYLFAKSPAHLFVIQAILGLSLALMTPAHDSLYTKHLDDSRFATGWGIWEGLYRITEAASAFIGGIIVVYVGFKALFVLMSGLSLVTAIYIWLLPRKVL